MKNKLFIFLILLPAIWMLFTVCQNRDVLSEKETKWVEISPYFKPPKKFESEFGDFRTPLKFYNGKAVKTVEDWKLRRREIIERWHKMMGPWPDIIRNQQLEYLEKKSRENFTQYKIRFTYVPNEKTEGYLLVPHGEGPFPAVVTVYYEPETAIGYGKPSYPYRDYAYQLVKRGFITLSIGRTNIDSTFYYPSINNVTVQPLSLMAYAAANTWEVLAKTERVDSTRIGIVGHSFGGKWAMFASCLYEKYACAVWSDPGIVFDNNRNSVNYWEPWYLGYHPKPWRERGLITEKNDARGLYPELLNGGYDLTELHALMAPRPFLVSGGSEDPPERWKALNHTISVNELLGFKNRIAMTNRPEHSPNEESNKRVYQFFEYFLNPNKR